MYQWLLNTIAGALCHPWQWWDASEEVTERLISSILDMASDSHFRGHGRIFWTSVCWVWPIKEKVEFDGFIIVGPLSMQKSYLKCFVSHMIPCDAGGDTGGLATSNTHSSFCKI